MAQNAGPSLRILLLTLLCISVAACTRTTLSRLLKNSLKVISDPYSLT